MSANAKHPAGASESDPRWLAVLGRDRAFDGKFYYAVQSTGVYCRPSCPARRPQPRNVVFFQTCAEADGAGFRPCRRCRPREAGLAQEHAAKVEKICRSLERAGKIPKLEELARAAGLSPAYFHRVFKAVTGLTPRAYAQAQRSKRVKSGLAQRDLSVTEVIYEAGFNSSSRFYESSQQVLGMTPSQYRAGGAGLDLRFAIAECSLGFILVAASAQGVCAIFLGDDPQALARELADRFPRARLQEGEAEFTELVAKVVAYVEAPGLGLDLPLDIRGTAFQQRVWQALREIPSGTTASYAEIARRVGAPRAARAVGRACGANPLAVVIPCHRVVRSDGGLNGYHWGLRRKRALLEKERAEKADGER